MRIALVVAAAGMAVGLMSFAGSASAAPMGPSSVVASSGDSLQVEAKAMRKSAARSTRGMRKIPKKKGL